MRRMKRNRKTSPSGFFLSLHRAPVHLFTTSGPFPLHHLSQHPPSFGLVRPPVFPPSPAQQQLPPNVNVPRLLSLLSTAPAYGITPLHHCVPATLVSGKTRARFRFSPKVYCRNGRARLGQRGVPHSGRRPLLVCCFLLHFWGLGLIRRYKLRLPSF